MRKMRRGTRMGLGAKQGSPALKSALTQLSPAKDGVRTVKPGRNSSRGFKAKIGM